MLFVATCLDDANSVPLWLETRPERLDILGARRAALPTPDRRSVLASLILEGESQAEIAVTDPSAFARVFEIVDPWQAVGAQLA